MMQLVYPRGGGRLALMGILALLVVGALALTLSEAKAAPQVLPRVQGQVLSFDGGLSFEPLRRQVIEGVTFQVLEVTALRGNFPQGRVDEACLRLGFVPDKPLAFSIRTRKFMPMDSPFIGGIQEGQTAEVACRFKAAPELHELYADAAELRLAQRRIRELDWQLDISLAVQAGLAEDLEAMSDDSAECRTALGRCETSRDTHQAEVFRLRTVVAQQSLNYGQLSEELQVCDDELEAARLQRDVHAENLSLCSTNLGTCRDSNVAQLQGCMDTLDETLHQRDTARALSNRALSSLSALWLAYLDLISRQDRDLDGYNDLLEYQFTPCLEPGRLDEQGSIQECEPHSYNGIVAARELGICRDHNGNPLSWAADVEQLVNGANCFLLDFESCNDGVDNDGNGVIDCADAGCADDPACEGQPADEVCNDDLDNDADGAIDCEDDDCFDDVECLDDPGLELEICGNGLDDDGNGLVDCEDAECALEPGCEEVDPPADVESCNDGVDNDGNGAIDCGDGYCAHHPWCGGVEADICGEGVNGETLCFPRECVPGVQINCNPSYLDWASEPGTSCHPGRRTCLPDGTGYGPCEGYRVPVSPDDLTCTEEAFEG